MNPILYKFMYKKYLDGFLSGKSIKCGTVHEFRGPDDYESEVWRPLKQRMRPDESRKNTENFETEGGINDPLEGRLIYHVPEASSNSSADQEKAKSAREQLGIDPFMGVRGANASFRDNFFIVRVPNYYIFCGSKNIDTSTIDRIKTDSERYSDDHTPYDVCVPIVDGNGFLNAMARSLADFESWVGNIEYCGGVVSYEKRVRAFGDSELSPPSVFTKDPFFESQAEARLLIK